MKVLILAHALRAGGGRATCTNILHSLRKLDSENEYYILVPDQPEYHQLRLESAQRKVHYYRRRFGHLGRRAFDKFIIKRIAAKFQPDLIWAMGGLGLIAPPCPQVVSIQNPYVMYGRKHWGRVKLIDRLWALCVRKAFKKQLRNTQMVICQTATMEKHLRESYRYQASTLVTWKGISAFAADWDGVVPPAIRPHTDKCKLLYITRYYPHKGLEILAETMERYREELANVVLFITVEPEQHPNAARLLKKIQQRGLADKIVNLGRLPQRDLASYYRSCDALVMPTRLESFSGTYLEAMHFGLPILTSDLDFAHEVCEDAALYFDPQDTASIRDAILRIRNEAQLGCDLRKKGNLRLAEMQKSWDEIVRNILHEFPKLVKRSGIAE